MFDLIGFAYVVIFRESQKVLFCNCGDFRNCQQSTILNSFLPKSWEEPIDLDPRKIQTYSTTNQYLFTNMLVLIGFAYVLKLRDSHIF